MTSRVGT